MLQSRVRQMNKITFWGNEDPEKWKFRSKGFDKIIKLYIYSPLATWGTWLSCKTFFRYREYSRSLQNNIRKKGNGKRTKLVFKLIENSLNMNLGNF